MPTDPLQLLRLAFKRAFTAYYESLCEPSIPDPTEAFEAARDYLLALRQRYGTEKFMSRLEAEMTELAGQIEQDLRQRWRDRTDRPDFADLEERIQECIEYGLRQLESDFGGARWPHTP